MRSLAILVATVLSSLFALTADVHARMNVAFERNLRGRATARHEFRMLDSPSGKDLATAAKITLLTGRRDPNGGEPSVLTDGQVPRSSDDPRANFFFSAGSSGGRLLVDLGSARGIDRVNSYSWHPGGRGPQVYSLWAATGEEDGLNLEPERDTALEAAGWTRVASVDSRPEFGELGGQYAISIFDSDGAIGPYRYLLFEISSTSPRDRFGNTFFGEIDVIEGQSPSAGRAAGSMASFETEGRAQRFMIDTSGSPDLTEWAMKELAPVVKKWYPKIVALLPSEGYEAPDRFTITIGDEIGGVAATSGTRIRCSGSWFRRNLAGEAKGAVVHELVHVVQRYGGGRRRGSRPPGWLVEGIADYIRWFLYEPETGGARITRRNLDRARHDASYRISGNFLDWVTRKHDRDIVPKLNAALREGKYAPNLWKDWTGSTVEELAAAWKGDLRKSLEGDGTSTGPER